MGLGPSLWPERLLLDGATSLLFNDKRPAHMLFSAIRPREQSMSFGHHSSAGPHGSPGRIIVIVIVFFAPEEPSVKPVPLVWPGLCPLSAGFLSRFLQ